MRVEISKEAQDDFDDAYGWYIEIDSDLSEDFLIKFREAVVRIVDFPHMWHKMDRNTRRCSMKRFPYGLVYTVNPESIKIVAVAHESRRPNYWHN